MLLLQASVVLVDTVMPPVGTASGHSHLCLIFWGASGGNFLKVCCELRWS